MSLDGKQVKDDTLELQKISTGVKILPNDATLGTTKPKENITNPNEFTTKDYADNSLLTSWNFLVNNFSVEPSINTVIASGTVYDYTYNSITRFRLVPDPYDPTQDAFYENFDGANLSSLITSRGI